MAQEGYMFPSSYCFTWHLPYLWFTKHGLLLFKRVQTSCIAFGEKGINQFWHKTVHSLRIYDNRNLRNLRPPYFLGSSVIQVRKLRYPKDDLASQTQEKKVRSFYSLALSVPLSKIVQGPWVLRLTGRTHLAICAWLSPLLVPMFQEQSVTYIVIQAVPIIPLGSGSSRDLENSVERGPNTYGCCRFCHWSTPDRATVPTLGDDLHSHPRASGLAEAPAAHCTNRFHLPDTWAARSGRPEKQYYCSKSSS